ncbi:cytochrome c oxidase subunit II [Oleisolibacter albus]|uniref:cytochrome c oxidase subunit II n=1 Tax=Oleisolibacter albus TaxID=2171757 RepID=UPI001EFE6F3B|nr:cytochrome c oxidase subunit II [Oleisolibacter albus]
MSKSSIFAKMGAAISAFGLTLAVNAAMAQSTPPIVGAPKDWQLGLQEAASPVKERLDSFHDLLLWIIAGIVLFVLALLVYVMLRFNRRANPTPSTTTHHTWLEIAWTGIPVLILLVIAVPSFRVLYYMEKAPNPELTVKITGHQWYWSFEYPDHEGLAFDARMLEDEEAKAKGEPRLLAVDNRIVVPVGAQVRVLVTGADVIHSFAIPALGVKKDAVPGRLNETWFQAEREGLYYGQCSEICGTGHGYMPIAIEAVPRERFDQWLAQTKQAMNSNGTTSNGAQPSQVAQTTSP